MFVMKFGGSVTQNSKGFAAIGAILEQFRSEPIVAVISAFGQTTRRLSEAARIAETGDEEHALSIVKDLIFRHTAFAAELLQSPQTRDALHMLIEAGASKLRDTLRGIAITRECTPRTHDMILSFGELFAVHITKHVLAEKGFSVSFVDATSIIATNNIHGFAEPDRELTFTQVREHLLPKLQPGHVVVVQGFVGKSQRGDITTMGLESSNLTATLLGETLQAQEVIIWSDVEGIRTADPNSVQNTLPLYRLSYSQAKTLAAHGIKLLHTRMIAPVERSGVPLRLCSAFSPNGDSTVISHEEFPTLPVIIIQPGSTIAEVPRLSGVTSATAETLNRVSLTGGMISLAGEHQLVMSEILQSGNQRVTSDARQVISHNVDILAIVGGIDEHIHQLLAISAEQNVSAVEAGWHRGVFLCAIQSDKTHVLQNVFHEALFG